MRQEQLPQDILGEIIYPNLKTFAFNPNYVSFKGVSSTVKKVTLAVGNYAIDAYFYQGKTRVDISRTLQLLFTDPKTTRVKEEWVEYWFNDDDETTLGSFKLCVVWGSSSIGERLNTIGAYAYNAANDAFERHVRWFPNMPQKLSIFNNDHFEEFTPVRSHYTYGLQASVVVNDLVWDNSFDDTFIRAFDWEDEDAVVDIYLKRDERTDGYFIRWIDNLGHWQYYLFIKNTRDVKVSTRNEYANDMQANGIYFGGCKQSNKNKSIVVTCGASDATKGEMAYLPSLVASPIVEIYMGKDSNDNEMWVPITIKDADYSYNERKEQQVFEIKFEYPSTESQQI